MGTDCPPVDRVPALRDVAAAWRRVRRRATFGPGFEVGICDPQEELLATARLLSADQLQIFSKEMAGLGYRPVAVRGQHVDGCDLLYVLQEKPRPVAGAGRAPL